MNELPRLVIVLFGFTRPAKRILDSKRISPFQPFLCNLGATLPFLLSPPRYITPHSPPSTPAPPPFSVHLDPDSWTF